MSDQTTEILLLPDGTLYVHNLTPEMAELLATLDPNDEEMRERAGSESAAEKRELAETDELV